MRPNSKTSDGLPTIRLEIYRDDIKKWHWRLISKAGIRAVSSQGYVSKQGCLDALKRVRSMMQEATLFDSTRYD